MKKNILLVILAVFIICGGISLAAVYTDVTPTKVDDEGKAIVVPVEEKRIKKTWEETKQYERVFSIEDKRNDLTSILENINSELKEYNAIVDDIIEANTGASLSVSDIPAKKQVTDIK